MSLNNQFKFLLPQVNNMKIMDSLKRIRDIKSLVCGTDELICHRSRMRF